MRSFLGILLILIVAPVTVALAQDPPPPAAGASQDDPLIAHTRQLHAGVKAILLSSAEQMPEEHYGFKPTDEVRSYGQIVGHVADAQYLFCSLVLGETNPAPKVEQTRSSKADLIAALEDAFAYCDRAYDGITSESATEMVNFMGSTPKLGALGVNQVHTMLHYGNLVTYMRMNGIVPPTSEPEFMKQLRR